MITTYTQKIEDIKDFCQAYALHPSRTLAKALQGQKVAGAKGCVLSTWNRLQSFNRNKNGCHEADAHTAKLGYVL